VVYPLPQEKRRFEIKGRTEYRDLTSLRFFGIGNDTSKDDRSTYLLNDRNAFAHLWINPRGLLSFGAQVGWYSAEAGPGDADQSAETVFDATELPGFGVPRTDFAVTGGWVEFDIRDKWAQPPVGIEARFTSLRYEDIDTNMFDFTRLIADIKGYIPLGYRSRIVAIRFRTSLSDRDSGSDVPFYLMETLGGAKTIRGFDEFRFRDKRNLLFQVEYRWEVWAYIDMTVFADAGKVFADMDDFNFKDLHTGYGFGLRIHTPGGWRLRFDLARSTDGIKFHVSSGPSF
jgi:outer membrane protein assembly factor BamA